MVKMLLDQVSHLSNESHSKFKWYRLKSAWPVKRTWRMKCCWSPRQSLDTHVPGTQTSAHTSQTGKLSGEPEGNADEEEEDMKEIYLLDRLLQTLQSLFDLLIGRLWIQQSRTFNLLDLK